MFRPNSTAGYQGYQSGIKAFCTPDIMSGNPLATLVLSTSKMEGRLGRGKERVKSDMSYQNTLRRRHEKSS